MEDKNEDIKKSMERIREAVARMRHTAYSSKLAEEYKNILEEVEKVEKSL